MNSLLLQAIKKAGQIRAKLKLDMFSPVNIFDSCAELEVMVRFVNVSMEGMYIHQEGVAKQTIFISSLRPMPRRVYTCAHELGHYFFKHGSKIDALSEEVASKSFYDNEEYLVDAFAGALLMPIAGIETEFAKRNWEIQKADPIQFYTISSIFGTGYSTLITHCKVNKLINEAKATVLLKQSPVKLLHHIMEAAVEKSHFKIIDNNANLSAIDLEVSNYLFLPQDIHVEGDHLLKLSQTVYGNAFIAQHPGIARAIKVENGKGHFIRIQKTGYVGLAENRHLEDIID